MVRSWLLSLIGSTLGRVGEVATNAEPRWLRHGISEKVFRAFVKNKRQGKSKQLIRLFLVQAGERQHLWLLCV